MPWWFANGTMNPPNTPVAEGALAPRHRVYQVYGAVDMSGSAEDHAATKFFSSFLKANGHPDRVVPSRGRISTMRSPPFTWSRAIPARCPRGWTTPI
ncbi:MAG TPA: hypothetical protein VM141_00910 [Planctomycetota bacterium]|nr:hypothetical protein [Planctomycetota bacterium]